MHVKLNKDYFITSINRPNSDEVGYELYHEHSPNAILFRLDPTEALREYIILRTKEKNFATKQARVHFQEGIAERIVAQYAFSSLGVTVEGLLVGMDKVFEAKEAKCVAKTNSRGLEFIGNADTINAAVNTLTLVPCTASKQISDDPNAISWKVCFVHGNEIKEYIEVRAMNEALSIVGKIAKGRLNTLITERKARGLDSVVLKSLPKKKSGGKQKTYNIDFLDIEENAEPIEGV